MNENKLTPVYDYDMLANIIKDTGSYCSTNHPIYRCESPLHFNCAVHDFVIGTIDFGKDVGDTCRMWVQFSATNDIYYCWEGFYVPSDYLKGRGTKMAGITSAGHTSRLVLTEKVRFKE